MNDTGKHLVLQLALPAEFRREVSNAWERLGETLEIQGVASTQGVPHLSLLSFKGIDASQAVNGLNSALQSAPTISIKLSHIGVFCGAENVLFIAATPSIELLNFQRNLYAAVESIGATHESFMQPGNFVPHVTLATGLSDLQCACALPIIREAQLFKTITCGAADLYEYAPPRAIAAYELE